MIELTGTENVELDALYAAVSTMLADQFIDTASEQAIKRRELQLGIRADTSTETLEFRRKRLINRYSTKPPFTIRYLQQRLDALVGAGLATATVDVQALVLTVAIGIPDAAYFREIEHTINQMKPANIIYNQQTALADRIGIEEHITATPLIRSTRLGTLWHVGVTAFEVPGEEVVIK